EALDLQKSLAEKSPTVAGLKWERARTTNNLAAIMEVTQTVGQAVHVYRDALARIKQLADEHPSVPDYQSELAIVSLNFGLALVTEADIAFQEKDLVARDRLHHEASGFLDDAVAIYRRLIPPERLPQRPDYRQKLALAEGKRGIFLDKTGQME